MAKKIITRATLLLIFFIVISTMITAGVNIDVPQNGGKSSDKKIIEQKIAQLNSVQPIKENIWVVQSENISLDNKTFVLSKENNSFSNIIFEIAQFSNVGKSNKFKILRI